MASYDYDPYGKPTSTRVFEWAGGSPRADYRYAGLFYHAPSGLYLTHYRVYDPITARWLSRDPIGETGGINLYGYVDGNPISFTDPLGLYPGESAINYVGGAVGGVVDFFRNYGDMRDANTIGGDKYFHCKANCEATKRGDGGRDTASCISDTREWADQHWPKNDPASASAADQVANRHGRDGADNNPGKSCDQICSPFRPRGLPSRY